MVVVARPSLECRWSALGTIDKYIYKPIMSNATKRSILRSIHLILSIPILGYIYGEPSEVQQYAAAVRFVFVPVIVLSGFWMYSGVFFAIIGVAVLLGAYYLSGYGAATLSPVALFIARTQLRNI
jgi:hypothetical protein